MTSQLTSLSNPKWMNAEHTVIDCEITTSQFGDEPLPFTADQNDVEAHGREIFADIVAGKYGIIADYIPLPVFKENTATPSSGEIPVQIL